MADGSARQLPATDLAEIDRLFGRMFDPPVEMFAWEVFARAFEQLEGNARTAEARTKAYEAFQRDHATCPQHVIDFCRATLNKIKK